MAQSNASKTCDGVNISGNSFWRKILTAADENKEVLPFIKQYFKRRDASLELTSLKNDAQFIAKVFPYYSVDYIAERLRVVGNEENSIAIVLRQLVAKHGESKASQEVNLKNLAKYCVEETNAKANTDDNSNTNNSNLSEVGGLFPYRKEKGRLNKFVMDILGKSNNNDGNINNIEPYNENRPSTSKDCTINKPCNSTKPATVVSSTSNLALLCEAANLELPKNATREIPDSQTDFVDETIERAALGSPPVSSNVRVSSVQQICDAFKSYSDQKGQLKNFAEPSVLYRRCPSASKEFNGFCRRPYDNRPRPTVIRQFNSWNDERVLRSSNRPATVTKNVTFRTSTRKQKKIDLVAYLKELFPDKSEQDIFESCLHHNIDVSKLPEDSVFDLLVQDLSSDEPTDLSIRKEENPEEIQEESIMNDEILNEGDSQMEEPPTAVIIEEVLNENEESSAMRITDTVLRDIVEKILNDEYGTEDDSKEEEPPAAKKAKSNAEDNMPHNFRFHIVKVNDSHERHFVQIPHVNENVPSFSALLKEPAVQLSDTDSCDDMNEEEMDVDDLIEPDLPHTSYDNKLLSKLMEIFPDACPIYIKRLCIGKTYSHEVIDEITNHIFTIMDYPKRRQKSPSPEPDWDSEKQLNILKEILPDADPNYLQYQVELHVNNQEKLKKFISNAIEKRNYPTMKEYLRKQQLSAQEKQYTSEFKVEKFLEVIPDPETYFNDPQRKPTVTGEPGDITYHYTFKFLKNMYLSLPIRTISAVLASRHYNLIKTKSDLDKIVKSGNGLLKSKRKSLPVTDMIQNIPFLQEIAYLQHQDKILDFIKTKKENDKKEKDKAREAGLLQTCNCCYDDEVMPNCILMCENGCAFCKACIQKSVEIAFGEGKLDFPCIGDCNSRFSLQTLQLVLSPKLFSKMVQRKQLEEVKAAGIEDLETCPFCDFATIPVPGDKLFRCFNPECMKESCRECKEPSHIPFRCDEIEKDDDVKRRVYIENKMTEALLRKCYKCGLKFIKSDGCNKMTCSCGASMCYICGKPVQDYKHFNGQGGDQYHLCPLYSDTDELHQQEVLRGAEEAKQEVGVNQDPSKLKIDPAADLNKHFQKGRARNQYQLPPGLHLDNAPQIHNQLGHDGFLFHVGVRLNQNHVQFDHIHRHHHHHHHHLPVQRQRRQQFL